MASQGLLLLCWLIASSVGLCRSESDTFTFMNKALRFPGFPMCISGVLKAQDDARTQNLRVQDLPQYMQTYCKEDIVRALGIRQNGGHAWDTAFRGDALDGPADPQSTTIGTSKNEVFQLVGENQRKLGLVKAVCSQIGAYYKPAKFANRYDAQQYCIVVRQVIETNRATVPPPDMPEAPPSTGDVEAAGNVSCSGGDRFECGVFHDGTKLNPNIRTALAAQKGARAVLVRRELNRAVRLRAKLSSVSKQMGQVQQLIARHQGSAGMQWVQQSLEKQLSSLSTQRSLIQRELKEHVALGSLEKKLADARVALASTQTARATATANGTVLVHSEGAMELRATVARLELTLRVVRLNATLTSLLGKQAALASSSGSSRAERAGVMGEIASVRTQMAHITLAALRGKELALLNQQAADITQKLQGGSGDGGEGEEDAPPPGSAAAEAASSEDVSNPAVRARLQSKLAEIAHMRQVVVTEAQAAHTLANQVNAIRQRLAAAPGDMTLTRQLMNLLAVEKAKAAETARSLVAGDRCASCTAHMVAVIQSAVDAGVSGPHLPPYMFAYCVERLTLVTAGNTRVSPASVSDVCARLRAALTTDDSAGAAASHLVSTAAMAAPGARSALKAPFAGDVGHSQAIRDYCLASRSCQPPSPRANAPGPRTPCERCAATVLGQVDRWRHADAAANIPVLLVPYCEARLSSRWLLRRDLINDTCTRVVSGARSGGGDDDGDRPRLFENGGESDGSDGDGSGSGSGDGSGSGSGEDGPGTLARHVSALQDSFSFCLGVGECSDGETASLLRSDGEKAQEAEFRAYAQEVANATADAARRSAAALEAEEAAERKAAAAKRRQAADRAMLERLRALAAAADAAVANATAGVAAARAAVRASNAVVTAALAAKRRVEKGYGAALRAQMAAQAGAAAAAAAAASTLAKRQAAAQAILGATLGRVNSRLAVVASSLAAGGGSNTAALTAEEATLRKEAADAVKLSKSVVAAVEAANSKRLAAENATATALAAKLARLRSQLTAVSATARGAEGNHSAAVARLTTASAALANATARAAGGKEAVAAAHDKVEAERKLAVLAEAAAAAADEAQQEAAASEELKREAAGNNQKLVDAVISAAADNNSSSSSGSGTGTALRFTSVPRLQSAAAEASAEADAVAADAAAAASASSTALPVLDLSRGVGFCALAALAEEDAAVARTAGTASAAAVALHMYDVCFAQVRRMFPKRAVRVLSPLPPAGSSAVSASDNSTAAADSNATDAAAIGNGTATALSSASNATGGAAGLRFLRVHLLANGTKGKGNGTQAKGNATKAGNATKGKGKGKGKGGAKNGTKSKRGPPSVAHTEYRSHVDARSTCAPIRRLYAAAGQPKGGAGTHRLHRAEALCRMLRGLHAGDGDAGQLGGGSIPPQPLLPLAPDGMRVPYYAGLHEFTSSATRRRREEDRVQDLTAAGVAMASQDAPSGAVEQQATFIAAQAVDSGLRGKPGLAGNLVQRMEAEAMATFQQKQRAEAAEEAGK